MLSQDEVEEDVLPRNMSPHLAAGQNDELSPCVGWQSNLKPMESNMRLELDCKG